MSRPPFPSPPWPLPVTAVRPGALLAVTRYAEALAKLHHHLRPEQPHGLPSRALGLTAEGVGRRSIARGPICWRARIVAEGREPDGGKSTFAIFVRHCPSGRPSRQKSSPAKGRRGRTKMT